MARKNYWSENTMIPIGLAIIVIGGGAGWVTKTSFQLSDHSDRLERIEVNSERIKSDVIKIRMIIGARNGSRLIEPPNIGDSASGTQGEDVPSLSRRIHDLKTGDETDPWPRIPGRPAQDMDDRS